MESETGDEMAKSESGNGWKIVLAGTLITAIATVTAAFITSAGEGPPPGSTTPLIPSTCLGPQAANVSAFLTESNVNFVIRISCPPTSDSQYVLIAQPRDIDVDADNPHPEYYLTWEMGQPTVGTYQHTAIGVYLEAGAQVTYYIISVDDTGFAQLQAQKLSGDFVLNLPRGYTVVSNRAILGR